MANSSLSLQFPVERTVLLPSVQLTQSKPSPFLKWAGGKTRLLRSLIPLFPQLTPPGFNRYFEPFLGGGAVLFHMLAANPYLKAYASDLNPELINCYLQIRDNVESVIEKLKVHRNDKHYFYKIREQEIASLPRSERAARLIFLNKTCFNGLYRENRAGQFNVPFGYYKNPCIVDAERLRSASRALKLAQVELRARSFEIALASAKAHDFVYLDPPYQPLSSTSSFTSYTKSSFARADQARLSLIFRELDRRGCYVMLSNSNAALVRELYADYQIDEIMAPRAINCQGTGRGRITELVVRNYR